MIPAKAGRQIRFTEGNVSILISLMPMAARMSHARVHPAVQRGIALRDKPGYFMAGAAGMESCYDRGRFTGRSNGKPGALTAICLM